MNGEGSVQIDRGQWLYRFSLDTDNIAIHRARRSGQDLAPPEAWRCVAVLGVSDAFVVAAPGGWQPFVELADERQRWALEVRATKEEAEDAVTHLLGTLADAVAHAAQTRAGIGEKETDGVVLRAPEPPPAPAEGAAIEEALAEAEAERTAAGWELIYCRQRANR
ncbi:MAG: hypothetical protein ACRDZX_14590 [Acidimicrobiales bacterium]